MKIFGAVILFAGLAGVYFMFGPKGADLKIGEHDSMKITLGLVGAALVGLLLLIFG